MMTRARATPAAFILSTVLLLALVAGTSQAKGSPTNTPALLIQPNTHLSSTEVNPVLRTSFDPQAGRVVESTPGTTGPGWTNLTTTVGPPRLSDASLAYDGSDQQMVLFGGFGIQAIQLNETWTFSNGTWTNISSTLPLAPSARAEMLMTYDPSGNYILAFGGDPRVSCSPSEAYGCADTWEFENDDWSQINATPPTPDVGGVYNEGFTMAYDSSSSYVLLTNGFDTWDWSGSAWDQFCGTNCTNFIPGPDLLGKVANDPAVGGILFYGEGYTWEFASGAWTNLSSSAGSATTSGGQLVYDHSVGAVLNVGNGGAGQNVTLDAFEDGSWSPVRATLSPPGRGEAAVAYDPVESFVLLFGGLTGLGTATNLNDTWAWESNLPVSGSGWTNLTTPAGPDAVQDYSAVFDPASNETVVFGGFLPSGYPTNSTWIFQNGVWTNLTSNQVRSPSARYGMNLVYDSQDGYVLGFGGASVQTPCPSADHDVYCNDTWEFSDNQWTQLDPTCYNLGQITPVGCSFVGGVGVPVSDDPTDGYVLACLCNGIETGGGDLSFVHDTWTDLTLNWTSNDTYYAPEMGAIAYDAADGHVLGFGAGFAGAFYLMGQHASNSTWEWTNNTTWINITSRISGAPPPRYSDGSLAYDSTNGYLILAGGAEFNCTEWGGESCAAGEWGVLSDTWGFADNMWTNLSAYGSFGSRAQESLVDDSADGGILSLGGATCGSAAWCSHGFTYQPARVAWYWGDEPPIAGLTISSTPTVPLPAEQVNFSASFAGGVAPLHFEWQFGDGASSSSSAPTHDYSSVGWYTVWLWVNDSAGHVAEASEAMQVYVPLSVAFVRVSPNPAALDQPVNFTASADGGTPPYTYSWSFGDGGTGGNLSNITHIFTTNGPFTVQVTATDSLGAVARDSVNVSIVLQAVAGVEPSNSSSSLLVSFIGQANGGVPPYSFDWSFGDGSANSHAQNPTHTYPAAGKYLVLLTVTDAAGNESEKNLTVSVGSMPVTVIGGPSTPTLPWSILFVAALVAAVGIGGAWVFAIERRKRRREEAVAWVNELVADPPSDEKNPRR